MSAWLLLVLVACGPRLPFCPELTLEQRCARLTIGDIYGLDGDAGLAPLIAQCHALKAQKHKRNHARKHSKRKLL